MAAKGLIILSILFAAFISLTIQTDVYINDIYRDCGSETGSIVSLAVTDCTKVPCIFVRGRNYSMDLQFTSKVDSNTAVNKVYGIIAKLPVPFHLPNDNGCTLGLSCPFKAGSTNSESVTLPVLAEYPKISVVVRWQVIDDKNKQLVCFEFPALLQ